jgi:hypothetical protein
MNAPQPHHPDEVVITVADGTPAAEQKWIVGSVGQYAGRPYRVSSAIYISAHNRRVRLISAEAWARGVR